MPDIQSLMESRSDFFSGASGDPATLPDPPSNFLFYTDATYGPVCQVTLATGDFFCLSLKKLFPVNPQIAVDISVEWLVYSGVADISLYCFEIRPGDFAAINNANVTFSRFVPEGSMRGAVARFSANGVVGALYPSALPWPAGMSLARGSVGIAAPAGPAVVLLRVVAVRDATAHASKTRTPVPQIISVQSTTDNLYQPCLYWPGDVGKPMVVSCHSGNGTYANYEFLNATLAACVSRGWTFISPNYRGASDAVQFQSLHYGSATAVQDVIDTINVGVAASGADASKVFIVGGSGGGHMSMLTAALNPTRFKAVATVAGIADLASWYNYCTGAPSNLGLSVYSNELSLDLGGSPSQQPAAYAARSPVTALASLASIPVSIQHGLLDNTVNIEQSFSAYNILAPLKGGSAFTSQFMTDVVNTSRNSAALPAYITAQSAPQNGFAFALPFRSSVGNLRYTLENCGHTGDVTMAFEFFDSVQ